MVTPFNKEARRRIMEAIVSAERGTSGEIRVHVRPRCGEDPLPEARKTFRRLGMQRTKEKNGVLLFVAWKSRRFAILGDEGIHAKVGTSFWEGTRDRMAAFFSKDDVVGGIEAGVRSAGERLQAYFPAPGKNVNELSDNISEAP